MKFFLFTVLLATFPFFTFALEEYNPEPVIKWQEGNMSAEYVSDIDTLTDKIFIRIGKINRTIPGPWSAASSLKRKKARKCTQEGIPLTLCGFYNYGIIRLSPSGNYIELVGAGWESGIWRMLDAHTGEIILSNDNMVRWSSWTPDRKQFIWITHDCGIGGCSDGVGVFMTIRGQFPKYKKIAPLGSIGEYTPTVLSNTLLTLVEKFGYDGKLLSKAIIHSFNLKNGSHF